MTNSDKQFRNSVESVLGECGNWLKANASDLADVFSSGCQKWSVEFSWNTADEMSLTVPEIDIRVRKLDKAIIEASIAGPTRE